MKELNQEELLDAIDDYDLYTITKRSILKAFVKLAIKLEVSITPTELGRLINCKRGIIYYNLKILEKDGFIAIKQSTQFTLNLEKLNQLIMRHKNKLRII